jgi:hypothetical protein
VASKSNSTSANTNANTSSSGNNIWIVALVLMVVIGTGVFWWARYASAAAAAARDGIVLTPEAKAYVRNLKIAEQEIKANESYMKLSLVEITGKIRNEGDRGVEVVEIYCRFYDAYGQIVTRERVAIVRAKMGGLKPGEEKPFRLAFDTIPESWNQAKPELIIAGIRFSN